MTDLNKSYIPCQKYIDEENNPYYIKQVNRRNGDTFIFKCLKGKPTKSHYITLSLNDEPEVQICHSGKFCGRTLIARDKKDFLWSVKRWMLARNQKIYMDNKQKEQELLNAHME